MFALCENMKWAHLPEPGGLYDQNPDLLEGFQAIFSERAEWEAEEEKKRKDEEAKNRRQSSPSRTRASRAHR